MLTYDDLEELAQNVLEEETEKSAGAYTGRTETKTHKAGPRAGGSYTSGAGKSFQSKGKVQDRPEPWRAPSEEFMAGREAKVSARLAAKKAAHKKARGGLLRRGWSLAKKHPIAAGAIGAGALAAGAGVGYAASKRKEASALDTLAFLRAQEIFTELGGDPDELELVEKTAEVMDWDELDQPASMLERARAMGYVS